MTFRQARWDEPSVWDLAPPRNAEAPPQISGIPEKLCRKNAVRWPELSELEVVRHYTRLSQMNFGIDTAPYPLGSCTMKYNPKVSELLARRKGAAEVHPYQPEATVQGSLEVFWRLERILSRVTGLPEVSLQPAAGAHGEYTAMLMVRAYSATSANSPNAPRCSYPTRPTVTTRPPRRWRDSLLGRIASKEGCIDVEELSRAVSKKTACFMLTNPNTAGLFESEILEIAETVHAAGAMLYYDGANLNAILGVTHPGRMGFDVAHLNLHKTFATPHGGGRAGGGGPRRERQARPVSARPPDRQGRTEIPARLRPAESIGKSRPPTGTSGSTCGLTPSFSRTGRRD